MKRKDLTDWIIHFVHDRNTANEPEEISNFSDETIDWPVIADNFTYDGKPIYQAIDY